MASNEEVQVVQGLTCALHLTLLCLAINRHNTGCKHGAGMHLEPLEQLTAGEAPQDDAKGRMTCDDSHHTDTGHKQA